MRSLTLEERAEPEHKTLRDDFDTHFTNRLGAAETIKDSETSDLTPECVSYEDPYSTIHEGYPYEVLPTPESWDNCVIVEIMLPRGDEMTMGRVTKLARDLDVNPLGTANENPILDTR